MAQQDEKIDFVGPEGAFIASPTTSARTVGAVELGRLIVTALHASPARWFRLLSYLRFQRRMR